MDPEEEQADVEAELDSFYSLTDAKKWRPGGHRGAREHSRLKTPVMEELKVKIRI